MFSAAPLPSLTRRLMMRSVPTSFKSQNRIPAFKNSFLWALSSWSVNPMIIFNNALIITGTHKLQHPLRRQGEPGVYQFRSWPLFGDRQIQQPKSGGRYKWPCPSEKDSKDFKTAGDWERGRERERESVLPAWKVLYSGKTYAGNLRNHVGVWGIETPPVLGISTSRQTLQILSPTVLKIILYHPFYK